MAVWAEFSEREKGTSIGELGILIWTGSSIDAEILRLRKPDQIVNGNQDYFRPGGGQTKT